MEAEVASVQVSDILESITDSFFSLDSQWRFTYVNQATERLFQKIKGELLGCSIWEVHPGLMSSVFDEQLRWAVTEQVAVHFEAPSVQAGIWGEVHAYPHQQGLSIYWRDITDAPRDSWASRPSEDRFRAATELSLDAFTILQSVRDEEGKIVDFQWTYVNPKAAQVLQNTVEGLVGKRLLQVLPGNKTNSELFDRYVTVVETGEPHDIELRYESEGIVGWFRNMAVKLDDGVAISFNDITERKQTEAERERLLQALEMERARFEAVLQQMPAGVMIADAASGNLVLTNEQAQIVGYGYEQPLKLEEYQSIVPFESFRSDGQCYAPDEYPLVRSLRTGEVVTNEEMELRRGDGSRILMNVNSAPILDNQEQILAAVVVFQDVTARQETQEALRQSEERFRQMAETIQDAFWITDFRGPQILYISPAYEQIWGRSPDALYQDYTTWVETIHPEDREKAIAIAATCQYENVVENEYRIVRPDGSIRWIRDRGFALRDEVGEIYQVVGVAQDVTQLKQTEIALRQSEERFQLIAQATNDVMWDYNVQTNQMWWSDRVQRLFGYQPEELGTDMQGWAERVHPDDLERIHSSYDTYLSTQESLWTGEYRFRRADGSYAHVHDRAYIIRDAEGKPVRIVGAMVDISDAYRQATQRKQAEENLRLSENRYRTLANAVSPLMWVNDANGNIEFFNQRWQEYTGVEALELGVGLWPNIIHPDDFQPTLEKRTQAIQARAAYEIECRLKRFDQTYRWH
ncbi:MAG: PAS domain S-box protein, partial [Cyanobacteriota bacterium]